MAAHRELFSAACPGAFRAAGPRRTDRPRRPEPGLPSDGILSAAVIERVRPARKDGGDVQRRHLGGNAARLLPPLGGRPPPRRPARTARRGRPARGHAPDLRRLRLHDGPGGSGRRRPRRPGPSTDDKTPKDAGEYTVRLVKARELFKPTAPSWIASSPRVDGDRVYVGAVHGAAFRSGAVYCLDRATGAVRWAFNDGGAMKDVFSSPCVADGKVYIGEGFHQHSGCKMYCLDADSGKKLWQVQTGSHTESSPCVVDGKLYFGAGDDGLFCVDAATGVPVWHEGKGLHVDASPLVVGGRLYCGSGVGDAYQETCVFCLDAATGKEIWRSRPTCRCGANRLWPAAGSTSAQATATSWTARARGRWRRASRSRPGPCSATTPPTATAFGADDVPDGVHVHPAVDRGGVYFASRDHHCYCLDRADGRMLWKKDLGSPVVASPALVGCPECGCSVSLYVAAGDGQMYCLDPQTGCGSGFWMWPRNRSSRPSCFRRRPSWSAMRRTATIGGSMSAAGSTTSSAASCTASRIFGSGHDAADRSPCDLAVRGPSAGGNQGCRSHGRSE